VWNGGPKRDASTFSALVPNGTTFGKRVFIDVMKLRISPKAILVQIQGQVPEREAEIG
jgi:hypothetical protein